MTKRELIAAIANASDDAIVHIGFSVLNAGVTPMAAHASVDDDEITIWTMRTITEEVFEEIKAVERDELT